MRISVFLSLFAALSGYAPGQGRAGLVGNALGFFLPAALSRWIAISFLSLPKARSCELLITRSAYPCNRSPRPVMRLASPLVASTAWRSCCTSPASNAMPLAAPTDRSPLVFEEKCPDRRAPALGLRARSALLALKTQVRVSIGPVDQPATGTGYLTQAILLLWTWAHLRRHGREPIAHARTRLPLSSRGFC